MKLLPADEEDVLLPPAPESILKVKTLEPQNAPAAAAAKVPKRTFSVSVPAGVKRWWQPLIEHSGDHIKSYNMQRLIR